MDGGDGGDGVCEVNVSPEGLLVSRIKSVKGFSPVPSKHDYDVIYTVIYLTHLY